jgi:hypothetical protein
MYHLLKQSQPTSSEQYSERRVKKIEKKCLKTKCIETCAFVGSQCSGKFSNIENFPMDSQLPRLHLHFAYSQPMYERATLPLYFYDKNHNSYQLDNFTMV